MANKAVIRQDRLTAGKNGPLASIKSTIEMENGMVFALGDKATITTNGTDASGEVFLVKEPKDAVVDTDIFVLHSSPEVIYNQGRWLQNDGTILEANDLTQFSVAIGDIGRAYFLTVGDVVTVSDALISGSTVANQYVVPFADATNAKTLKAQASFTTEKLVFKVTKKETMGVGRFGLNNNAQASTQLMVIRV